MVDSLVRELKSAVSIVCSHTVAMLLSIMSQDCEVICFSVLNNVLKLGIMPRTVLVKALLPTLSVGMVTGIEDRFVSTFQEPPRNLVLI